MKFQRPTALFAVFLLSGAVLVTALPSEAQNINAIETRMDRMEREMQTLSRSVFRGDVPPPQLGGGNARDTAAMELRLNQMEEQLRDLTGRIEEQGYQTRQLEKKLDDFVNQTTSRLNSAPAQTPASTDGGVSSSYDGRADNSVTSSSSSTEPYRLGTLNGGGNGSSPAGLYDQAFSYLQTNDYVAAEKTFNDFIAQYPDHSLAANAKYWLGETFYARGDYSGASRAFAKSYQDHPEGQKAPDTLLKLAMSLGEQGMKPEACLTLSELVKRFPNGPVSVMQKADEETRAYDCGS